jgi:coenzyme F420-reducing hydrogenase gamma subunit
VSAPKVAVWKFASCDGCQLSLLSAEDELLTIAGEVQIAYFLEATREVVEGPYDISLVEGSITTPHDRDRIRHVRAVSQTLITIGACATSGGIQALRNFGDMHEFRSLVYAHPDYVDSLEHSTAIAEHVDVDFELRGCPIETDQLVEVINAYLAKRKPVIPSHSVCVDCKLRGIVCVAVAHGQPCLGPVTHTGCGARCPGYARGCYGCFGPVETPNTTSLADHYTDTGVTDAEELTRAFRTFNADAPAFRSESRRREHQLPVVVGAPPSDGSAQEVEP